MQKELLPLYELNRGDAVTIAITAGGKVMGPMAVGVTLMSSQEMVANKFEGKGVQILHLYRDLLWEFGSRLAPPVHELVNVFNPSEAKPATSDANDFPPLGSLSVRDGQVDAAVHDPPHASDGQEAEHIDDDASKEEQQPEEPMDDLVSCVVICSTTKAVALQG
ncbi:unnamed protein product [Cylicostephanus goldi]|uniref:Eukaryotic translation initiation factor 2D-like PUA RNA-binding domain-containing protein n=1 Tax=Cylicostephanus goldi TaxID=71465 RepID=A0A3P6SX97_CYLGO|nr:unnamed protein product [Cylicostephanus goldi]